MVDSAEQIIAADLRNADLDRYLSTLYAPADKREALQALYAFNAEIVGIRQKVTQPLAGEMRIQWWRDQLQASVQSASNAEQGHPTLSALTQAIKTHNLPLKTFDNYLDARIFDLYDDPMPSKSQLEGYLGETSSALIQLAALILSPENASRYAEAAGYGGCAQGIVAIIHGLPLHRRKGQTYMPGDILDAVGLSAEEFATSNDERTTLAVIALAAMARQHLRDFEKAAKGMPQSMRPAFLPVAVTGYYIDRIEADPKSARILTPSISPLRRHLNLARRALQGW